MIQRCNGVKQLHSRVVGNSHLLSKYLNIRANFLASFPECREHLERVERIHRGRVAQPTAQNDAVSK